MSQTRYFGTPSLDIIYGIQFDGVGFPYIMGISLGSWTVTANATYRNAGSKQFISKLQPDLSGYVYSTVYGAANSVPNISPVAFLVDRCENVYISGWGGRLNTCVSNSCFDSKTSGPSGMPITPDAIKNTTDGRDFYFFVMEKDAAGILYGSYYGQTGGEGDHVDGGPAGLINGRHLSGTVPIAPVTMPVLLPDNFAISFTRRWPGQWCSISSNGGR